MTTDETETKTVACTAIRPGIIVISRTRIIGGISYSREDLAPEGVAAGTDVKTWKTTRVIDDPAEYERARTAQSAAAAAVAKPCVLTDFGLVCPAEREGALDAAIAAARAIAQEHNRTATSTLVELRVLKGRISVDDAGAAEALVGEAEERLVVVEALLDAGDEEKARKEATRAKSMTELLSEDVAARVLAGVQKARARATVQIAEAKAAAARAASIKEPS